MNKLQGETGEERKAGEQNFGRASRYTYQKKCSFLIDFGAEQCGV